MIAFSNPGNCGAHYALSKIRTTWLMLAVLAGASAANSCTVFNRLNEQEQQMHQLQRVTADLIDKTVGRKGERDTQADIARDRP